MVYITSKSVSLNIHLELQLNVQIFFYNTYNQEWKSLKPQDHK